MSEASNGRGARRAFSQLVTPSYRDSEADVQASGIGSRGGGDVLLRSAPRSMPAEVATALAAAAGPTGPTVANSGFAREEASTILIGGGGGSSSSHPGRMEPRSDSSTLRSGRGVAGSGIDEQEGGHQFVAGGSVTGGRKKSRSAFSKLVGVIHFAADQDMGNSARDPDVERRSDERVGARAHDRHESSRPGVAGPGFPQRVNDGRAAQASLGQSARAGAATNAAAEGESLVDVAGPGASPRAVAIAGAAVGVAAEELELFMAPRGRFEVCHAGGTVMSVPGMQAQVVGRKAMGDQVAGFELTMDGWLRLHGDEGWMAMDMHGHEDLWKLLLPMGDDERARGCEEGREVGGYHSQGLACFEVLAMEAWMFSTPCPGARRLRCCAEGELVFGRARTFDGWLRLAGDGDGWMRLHDESTVEPSLRPRSRTDASLRNGNLSAVADLWAAARRWSCASGGTLPPSTIVALKAAELAAWRSAREALTQMNANLPASPLVTAEILRLPQIAALKQLFRRSIEAFAKESQLYSCWQCSEVAPSLPSTMQVCDIGGFDFLVDVDGLIFEEHTGNLVGAWNEEGQQAEWWLPFSDSPEGEAIISVGPRQEGAATATIARTRANSSVCAAEAARDAAPSEVVSWRDVQEKHITEEPTRRFDGEFAEAENKEKERLEAKNNLLQKLCSVLQDGDLEGETKARLGHVMQANFDWLGRHSDASREEFETKLREVEHLIQRAREEGHVQRVVAARTEATAFPDGSSAKSRRNERGDDAGSGCRSAGGRVVREVAETKKQPHRPSTREETVQSVTSSCPLRSREHVVTNILLQRPDSMFVQGEIVKVDGATYRVHASGEVFDVLTGELVGAWDPVMQRMEMPEDVLLVEHKDRSYIVTSEGVVLDAETHLFVGSLADGSLPAELSEAIAGSSPFGGTPGAGGGTSSSACGGTGCDSGGWVGEGDLWKNLEVAREMTASGRHRLAAKEYGFALRKCEGAKSVDLDLEVEVLLGRAACWSKLGSYRELLGDAERILAVDERQAEALAWRREAQRAMGRRM
mmetsp:Transcript_19973/g.69334  ORF Transcript_19973/g.69334 Transcript_19973/m.69334 type:complete len:1043 (-) Transcript_19973:57-3185(-)